MTISRIDEASNEKLDDDANEPSQDGTTSADTRPIRYWIRRGRHRREIRLDLDVRTLVLVPVDGLFGDVLAIVQSDPAQ